MSIYITDAVPGSVNGSKILETCRNNTFYPVVIPYPDEEISTAAITPLILFILFGVILFILIIILVSPVFYNLYD